MSDKTLTTVRLRNAANKGPLPFPYGNSLMHEAADEIERLRQDLETAETDRDHYKCMWETNAKR